MESDASTSPRRRSTSCYSDSGDSSCSEPFSECGSDDLSFTPAAAAGIHRLLLSCAAEASEDAIASLVAELDSPSPSSSLDSLRRAAMELRLLAKHNPDNRVRIAAAGGVRPLVKLLSHADPLLQEHGVTALLNLSICDENKAIIVEAGAVRPLVHALKSAASPAARENAACALLRQSQLDGASAAAIRRPGTVLLLISLLENRGTHGKKDEATALCAICGDARENRQHAVEAGGVRPLLDLMADLESSMVDKAAYVLHSLVSSAEAHKEVMSEAIGRAEGWAPGGSAARGGGVVEAKVGEEAREEGQHRGLVKRRRGRTGGAVADLANPSRGGAAACVSGRGIF